MKRDALLSATMEFFFEAMLRGYLGDAPKFSVPGEPSMRGLRVKIEDFELLDKYSRKLGTRLSFGQTIIWHKDEPVWAMQYHGKYEKRAIPLLKLALAANYRAKKFNGGRGQDNFGHVEHHGLVYSNQVLHWEFARFSGRESIRDHNLGQSVGWHEYHGLFLL